MAITLTAMGAGAGHATPVPQPQDGRVVHARHVLFIWESDPDAVAYLLQVEQDRDYSPRAAPLFSIQTPTNGAIVKEGLNFGQDYTWRTRGIDRNGTPLEWSELRRFRIVEVPDSILNGFEVIEADVERMQPGVTLATTFGPTYALDNNGSLIWYIHGVDFNDDGQWDISQLPDGNFAAIHRFGVRVFNIYNDTLWFSREYENAPVGAHHEAFPKSDGNFLYLTQEFRWVPRGENDSLYWAGGIINEINRDGEPVWRWSCWDHFSTDDYDPWEYDAAPPGGFFDWTHCNACTLDESEGVIYLSVRNLSRIVKIDYPSGEIIWSMGLRMPSGDIDFGWNLEFYRQHAPEPQPNGNLLFFDNHWYGNSDFSRAMEVGFDFDADTVARVVWEYRTEHGTRKGDADRLPNGNTLICGGSNGILYEVTADGELVWKIEQLFQYNPYRAERVASLYPLVFTVTGPADSSQIPSLNSWTEFSINNIGEVEQEYRYRFSDSRGWLDTEAGLVRISPGRRAVLAMLGFVPQVEEWDELTFIMEPVVAPEAAETLRVHVQPGEPNSVGGSGITPAAFSVSPAFPNPFNSRVNLALELPPGMNVDVAVYDALGRRVNMLAEGLSGTGRHRLVWNGGNDRGGRAAAGTYILVVTDGQFRRVQSINLLP